MKEYIFKRDSYWTDNGCSCCEADEWEIFDCTSHPEDICHTLHSEEDCFIAAILDHNKREDDYAFTEYLQDLSYCELIMLAEELEIGVVIFEGGEPNDM